MSIVNHLVANGITPDEIKSTILPFRTQHEHESLNAHPRLTQPERFYRGELLKIALQWLVAGKHIILEGPKGCGKNTLADTLAYILRRPQYELVINGQMTVSDMFGEKTLHINDAGQTEVVFQKHQLLEALLDPAGAIVVADEINMGRPEVLTTLNSIADTRRRVDIPGFGQAKVHPAFRLIGTMNYGYMGTTELNEALADRFVILHVPALSEKEMANQLREYEPTLLPTLAERLAKLFNDLNTKAVSGAISSKAVTVRGLYQVIDGVKAGVDIKMAFQCCVTNKAFDQFERTQVQDTINTLFKTTEPWFITPSAPSTPVKPQQSRFNPAVPGNKLKDENI